MSHLFRCCVAALAATGALLCTGVAAAAPTSTTFAVVGYEYAFTSTEGFFAGAAVGNAGETGAWNTNVVHDPLGSSPTHVNGGSFQMATVGGGGALDTVTGTFVHHGGMITTLDPGANCTNQRYRVTGSLQDVATSTTSGGTGTFTVTLTHYRTSLFGHCIIYKAKVAGAVGFSY
jgi:hypothetical protein